jgi:hypothetical protein
MSAAYLQVKAGGALLNEVRDTLFEILSPETRHHLAYGNVKSFAERMKHSLVDLVLDHAQGARAHGASQFVGTLVGSIDERFPADFFQ